MDPRQAFSLLLIDFYTLIDSRYLPRDLHDLVLQEPASKCCVTLRTLSSTDLPAIIIWNKGGLE